MVISTSVTGQISEQYPQFSCPSICPLDFVSVAHHGCPILVPTAFSHGTLVQESKMVSFILNGKVQGLFLPTIGRSSFQKLAVLPKVGRLPLIGIRLQLI